MWKNEVCIDIAAPTEKVFNYLADFARHSEWSMSVAGGTHLVQWATFYPISAFGNEFLLIRQQQVEPENIKSLNRIKAILER